jgi:hypothetical protein
MNRRNFLLNITGWLIGSFFGLNSFSKAFAIEKHRNHTVDQPRIALIIDDIGFSRSHAKQFLNIGVPITFAILPRLVYSYDLALEIHDNGHEILLHQPMEPYNIDSFDPGPGALYVGDGADRIERIIEENIAGVPYAVGVNNHMGSRFTEAYKETRQVLENVKKRDLFFVDSFTSSHSIGYRTARKLRMAATGRNIFLDNIHDESAIYNQLIRLKRHSKKYGHAVGIGHPFPETIHTIDRFVTNIKDSDISLVHVSDVL